MAEKWIQKALPKSSKGKLHEELHVKEGHKIPQKKLEKAAHAGGKEGKRANLAITLEGMHRHKEHKEGYSEKHHKR